MSRASRSEYSVEGKRRRRHPGPLRADERTGAGVVGGDRDDRNASVEQRLQVRALTADEDAYRACPSDSPCPASTLADHEIGRIDIRWADDGAVADADVEDAAQLVLGHPLLREPCEDGRPLPAAGVDDSAEPVRAARGRGFRRCRRR